jgi:5-hmdU DNA kinase, helical domain
MNIANIPDPIERFVAFVEERENIRARRESGKPWPWTQDLTLQTYRFTNIHREDDKVSRHYQKTIRNRYEDSPLVLPGTVLYRWFNRISTCDAFFNEPDFTNKSAFEAYIETGNLDILQTILTKIPSPHVTGAFIVTGLPGYQKGEGVLLYFHTWCQKPWEEIWIAWRNNPPLLSEMYELIGSTGLGSFMRGQLVADLKYLPFMLNVPDWWEWATPGPGSMRGLNIVFGRPMNTVWRKGEWLEELRRLNSWVMPRLEKIGIDKLHNQDLQNCLCEFSKFTKATTNAGRPRQRFQHA